MITFGYANVGKTSLISKYIFNHFPRHQDNNKVANNVLDQGLRKFIKYDQKKIELEVRDTPSYDRYFIFVSQRHSVKIDGYILMYSVDNLSSFELVKEIRQKLFTLNNQRHLPTILLANKKTQLKNGKIDLKHKRKISTEEGQALADFWNIPFIECSLKHSE